MSLHEMSDHNLRERFELLKGAEHHKNELIVELLCRLDKLDNDYQQMCLDHQRETQYNREGQRRERQLQEDIRRYTAQMNQDAFVLVLIDGDGMIFNDDLVRKGEIGGKEAAGKLWGQISDFVHESISTIPPDYKIVARVYANLKGLGDICHKSGILEKPGTIEDFARGFTGSKVLFDFIDVGSGKDRADEKITELFKLHLSDTHCHHIFFGCSHDNGYARLLEEYADQPITKRITLLEGVPFEKELNTLRIKYSTTKFEGLFRPNKINVYATQQQHSLQFTTPKAQVIPDISPFPSLTQSNYQPNFQPALTASASTPSPSPGNVSIMNPKAPSWASTANAAAQIVSPPPTPQPSLASLPGSDIPRNRKGQRIDPITQYDKTETARVKQLHLCNVHFLRGDCPYEPCTHNHNYKPTKNELTTLRVIARMVPCRFGSECDDAKCMYGHRCPLSNDGKKECRFGVDCNFERSLHGLDLQIVRTTQIGKK